MYGCTDMSEYACMYVYIYIYIYICVCMYIYLYIYIYMMCMYVCIYIWYTYECINMHLFLYLHNIYIYIYGHLHLHTHMFFIYTCIYDNICIYTLQWSTHLAGQYLTLECTLNKMAKDLPCHGSVLIMLWQLSICPLDSKDFHLNVFSN